MTAPAKINFKVYQGSTFGQTLRWESLIKTYVPITAITKAAPVVITAAAHGIPIGWRVKFTNIVGMTELNSNDLYYLVTDTTVNTITVNSLNSLGYKDYISGGIIEYNTPTDLAGYTARMQIRAKLDSTAIIYEMTTELNNIVLDNVDKTIDLIIPADITAAFTFNTAVYSLELVSLTEVISFATGNLTLIKEVTR